MTKKAKEIRALARAEQAAYDRHQKESQQISERIGEDRLVLPGTEYDACLGELLAAYDSAALPQAARSMADLQYAYDGHVGRRELNDPMQRGRKFTPHDAWSEVIECRKRAVLDLFRDPPEPIPHPDLPAKLKEQGLTLRQIATVWGWYRPHELHPNDREFDMPDVARVERELASPGTEANAAEIERHQKLWLVGAGFALAPQEDEPVTV